MTILVISLVLFSTAALTGCLDDGTDQETPESTFESFFQRVEEGDGEGAVELTDLSLLEGEDVQEQIDIFLEDIEDVDWESYEIHGTRYEDDMDEEELGWLDEIRRSHEDHYGIEMDDHCVIDFTVVSDGEEESGVFPMVEYDGKWYLVLAPIRTDEEDNVPTTGAISVHERDIENNNLTLQIVHMGTPSSASLSDVEITVFDPSGIEIYSGSPGYGTPDDLGDGDVWWIYLPVEGDEIREGARLRIHHETDSFRNYEVIMSIDGYVGTISRTVS